jgi:hypothetical protein
MAIEWSVGGINSSLPGIDESRDLRGDTAEIQPVTQRCGNDRLSPYRLMELNDQAG